MIFRSSSEALAFAPKVFCDNYLDGGYHVPYAHGGLASGLDLDSYTTSVNPLQLLLLRLDLLSWAILIFPRQPSHSPPLRFFCRFLRG